MKQDNNNYKNCYMREDIIMNEDIIKNFEILEKNKRKFMEHEIYKTIDDFYEYIIELDEYELEEETERLLDAIVSYKKQYKEMKDRIEN